MSEHTMKERINTHYSNFRLPNYESATSLSEYIWKLKRHFFTYHIKWKVVARAKPYNPATKTCNLCTKEKYFIIFKPETATLNSNHEMLKKCVHRRKWLMSQVKEQ